MMMVSYCLSRGSPCVSASKMPSVMSLTHAPAVRVSLNLTLKPACTPGAEPNSCAMRFAVDDAAIRRGWVCPIKPCSPRPMAKHSLGN